MSRLNGTRGMMKFCFWLLLLYIFLGSQELLPLPEILTDVLIVAVILVSSVLDGWRVRLRTDKYFGFAVRHFLVPVILILVYSIVMQVIRGLSFDYLQNTITTQVRFFAYYLLGIVVVRIFGRRTVDYLLWMAAVAYIPAFAKHFQQYGFVGGISIMFDPQIFHIQTPLEIHTMTYIFGFIALYYAYQWFVEKEKSVKWRFFISIFLTVIGTKRIILAGIAVAILVIVILKRIKPGQRYSLMRFACVLLIASSFLFLYLVDSGILEKMVESLGVESSARFVIWNLLQDQYDVNPLFMGYGISYGARIMHYVWQDANLAHAVSLHNDILRVFLGLGFLGSLLYWYNYFYATMRRARRICSIDAAMFIFAMAVYFYINAMTSNEGVSPMTNGMYFMIIFTVVCYGSHSREKEQTVIERGDSAE